MWYPNGDNKRILNSSPVHHLNQHKIHSPWKSSITIIREYDVRSWKKSLASFCKNIMVEWFSKNGWKIFSRLVRKQLALLLMFTFIVYNFVWGGTSSLVERIFDKEDVLKVFAQNFQMQITGVKTKICPSLYPFLITWWHFSNSLGHYNLCFLPYSMIYYWAWTINLVSISCSLYQSLRYSETTSCWGWQPQSLLQIFDGSAINEV